MQFNSQGVSIGRVHPIASLLVRSYHAADSLGRVTHVSHSAVGQLGLFECQKRGAVCAGVCHHVVRRGMEVRVVSLVFKTLTS